MDGIDQLNEWRGQQTRAEELIAPAPLGGLAATLGAEVGMADGDAVPPLWHWLYFLPRAPQSEIGADGHPQRGGFLPPVPLPRRMWAGGRISFLEPLHVGQRVVRTSTVTDVNAKQGRSGALVFVTVQHKVACGRAVLLEEEQDLVYREAAVLGAPAPAAPMARRDEQFARSVTPDPVLLFRYSALTFNGHRIHYDRDYAREVEAYPGLVVHGPLIATLLIDLLRRQLPGAQLAAFSFKAISALFDHAPFELCGRLETDSKTVTLWARNADGQLAMDAVARLA
ncbi:MaoC family dehydratase N-terminal domain-containing protein [Duganella sp. BuS-21]|uniref:FAS1-like dehydratase domain-containing protein n=1 Tax=Duganella sp. BuS-21 TaxID=2943848 RepID=UPI0035A5C3F2